MPWYHDSKKETYSQSSDLINKGEYTLELEPGLLVRTYLVTSGISSGAGSLSSKRMTLRGLKGEWKS